MVEYNKNRIRTEGLDLMEMSVCIITANESEYLEKCLECISRYPFEIVVVDTGSQDNSKEIAGRYTDKVYSFKWDNDFAEARNFSVSKAGNDMVMIVDTDEFVQEFDWNEFVRKVSSNTDKIGRINLNNVYSREGSENSSNEKLSRIFDRRLYRYEGAVHEQIVPIGDKCVTETYEAGITFRHVGYEGTPDNIKKKTERNIVLLKKELSKGEDPYLLYQLGKSNYMAGNYDEALRCFERASSYDLDPKLEYVLDMIISYGYTMINLKMTGEAMGFINLYDDFSYSADYVFLMGLIFMNNARFDEAVTMFTKAQEYGQCSLEGVNSYLAEYNIGVIYQCLGYREEALAHYRKCGDYKKAKERIQNDYSDVQMEGI